MIIDADCHISPTPERGVSIGAEELIRRMDEAGVEKAVVWLQPPYRREVAPANRYVYESVRAFPDRLLGFGWVDPNLGVEESKDEARRCIEKYGFYGVKLNGAQNDYYIDDPVLSLPVIDAIAATGRMLAFHVGADACERTHPFRVAKIARRHPGTPMLLAHMGGASFADLGDATIEFAQQCENLVLIGSAIRTAKILKAIRTLGASRVCYGSDTPFELMRVEVARYKAMLQGEASDEDQALIMGGNIARLFAGARSQP